MIIVKMFVYSALILAGICAEFGIRKYYVAEVAGTGTGGIGAAILCAIIAAIIGIAIIVFIILLIQQLL